MLKIGPIELESRLILGTGKFENGDIQREAVDASETNALTFAVRRMNLYDKDLPNPLESVDLDKYITFPNTAGAKTAEEAVKIAEIARAAGMCDMIKVEIIGDDKTLLPDAIETYKACEILIERGFIVCPYIQCDVAISVPVIVDAGIGSPSDAAYAMELGADAVLLNTAVSHAKDPVKMAEAMKLAVHAGFIGAAAGRIPKKYTAQASSPTEGLEFL